MCLDIIVLVVIMYSILGGYKSSFCCQDNKEELGIVTTITSILFLDGVDYVLVTQTLVTYQVTCKGKVNRLNGFKILDFVSCVLFISNLKYRYVVHLNLCLKKSLNPTSVKSLKLSMCECFV